MGRGRAWWEVERQAQFVAFDVLADAAADLRPLPLVARRQELAVAFAGVRPPQTPGLVEAQDWMENYLRAGLEGLVLKRTDQLYVAGRIWWKYRARWPVDFMILGVTDAPTGRPDTVSIDMETSTSG